MRFKTGNNKPKVEVDKPKAEGYQPSMDDIIIPVMGPSGAGKSTFINYLAGEDVVRVGHDAESCTTELEPIILRPPSSILLGNRRLVLVDTPGFDETFTAESDTLKRIASWLGHVYSADTKLGGVIYLHDISLARVKGTARRNLEVFKKLCGDRALRSVVLGTTKWSDLEARSVGEARQKQLCDLYWKEMIKHGSIVHNFEDSWESAWDMVDSALAYDVIIPVIGVTGVGKSLFVNTLAGRPEVTVGEDMQLCTSEVQPVVIDPILANNHKASYHGRGLIVVDTPGFDDTYIEDSKTLKNILDYLTTRYGANIKLGGIILLHDVNTRPHSKFREYLDAIAELCAEPRSLILGTTKWGDEAKHDKQEAKLNNLTTDYWKGLIDDGAQVHKFTGSQDSAWMMVKAILDDNAEIPHRTEVLQIQEELVRAKKVVPDTEAGRHLCYSLDDLLKTLDKSSSKGLDPAQIASIRAQIKALHVHVPLSRRFSGFFDSGVNKIRSGFRGRDSRVGAPES